MSTLINPYSESPETLFSVPSGRTMVVSTASPLRFSAPFRDVTSDFWTDIESSESESVPANMAGETVEVPPFIETETGSASPSVLET